MEFSHYSVMLEESIAGLAIRPDGIYVDGTAGGAGHSCQIAKRLTTGKLFALDKDPDAVSIAEKRLAPYGQAAVIQADFKDLGCTLRERGITGADGILLDLGVSSHQLDTAQRGFSYHQDGPLDMRMSQQGLSAQDLVNTYSVADMTRIIREFGEEKYAFSIAKNIEKARAKAPITTTGQLADIIRESVPYAARREKNPAKKTFQAIRIAVNGELEALSQVLDQAFDFLNPGGRFAIITFHSLEDRMVKQKFADFARGCICPPDFPVCVCGRSPRGTLVSRKPILPREKELAENRRSRSAKLRVIEKTKDLKGSEGDGLRKSGL
ncbi:MAG: 16S rRNA (cytosine(1402)-N(4))-methyltransferase RsmH [Oscillospiraceae bacterium]|nr:16S rRNA (cytosine(1402)-N(4))-methyltransferase RsmH [Oscillospiraceae bacterium]